MIDQRIQHTLEQLSEYHRIHNVGDVISGTVMLSQQWGVIIDIGEPFQGFIDILNLSERDGRKVYPPVGASIDAVFIDIASPGQLDLGNKAEYFLWKQQWEDFKASHHIGDMLTAVSNPQSWPYVKLPGFSSNKRVIIEGANPHRDAEDLDIEIPVVITGFDDHMLQVLVKVWS